MRSIARGHLWLRRAVFCCTLLALSAALLTPADARTRRQKKRGAFGVALQPFLLARSVVHAVAEPIVHHAPRAVYRAATLPVRVARALPVPRPEPHGSYDDGAEYDDEIYDAPAVAPQQVRRARPLREGQAIRVAYMAPRRESPAAPQSDLRDYEDDEEPQHEPPQVEHRGSRPIVQGSRAVLRNGIAYAPSRAPESVKQAIWAGNALRRKPYVWGGGHASFHDRGYDCSGTVSYALHAAGALGSPLPSSELMRYGKRGRGRWITVYSRRGHTFAIIAGLRLDTTDFRNGGNTGPRWHSDMRETRGYVARHPQGL